MTNQLKHIFIIQAHNQLPLLKNLVEMLSAPNHFFLIHLDKKAKMLLADPIIQEIKNLGNAEIMCYKLVNWGGANQFFLTLELLRKIPIDNYDFVHLLSGVDMPIRSNESFDTFFEKTEYEGLLTLDSMEMADKRINDRLGRFYLYDVLNYRNTIQRLLNRIVSGVQKMIQSTGVVLRKPISQQIYSGSQWFSVSQKVAKYVVDYCSTNKAFVKRFKWSNCCDELFFNTIIMNSPFASQILRSNLRYVDWKEKIKGETLPRVLIDSDFDDIIKSNCLFCRKIDLDKSQLLINKIKEFVLSQK